MAFGKDQIFPGVPVELLDPKPEFLLEVIVIPDNIFPECTERKTIGKLSRL